MRYDPALPDVLKGITFSIAPGEKVRFLPSLSS